MEKRVIGGQCRRLSREECERKEGRKEGRERRGRRKEERKENFACLKDEQSQRERGEKRDGRGGWLKEGG